MIFKGFSPAQTVCDKILVLKDLVKEGAGAASFWNIQKAEEVVNDIFMYRMAFRWGKYSHLQKLIDQGCFLSWKDLWFRSIPQLNDIIIEKLSDQLTDFDLISPFHIYEKINTVLKREAKFIRFYNNTVDLELENERTLEQLLNAQEPLNISIVRPYLERLIQGSKYSFPCDFAISFKKKYLEILREPNFDQARVLLSKIQKSWFVKSTKK